MEKVIIIRYGEIHLKGKNRSYFEKMLQNNILSTLKGLKFRFTPLHSRYIIDKFSESEFDIFIEKLKKIAGIHTFSVAYCANNDVEEIFSVCKELMKEKDCTFKVRTNRADKSFPINSMEFSRLIGGRLLEAYPNRLKVDVNEPEVYLDIDIREDKRTFIFTDVINGLGGMPVGSAGKGVLLISGGIDSPVAGYMMAKRGMKLIAVHYHSFPYTSEMAKEKVVELSKIVAEYNGGINLYVVPFTKIQEAIHENCDEEYMITMMRRFMMRIAERIAENNGCMAIVTGESLGQVASQTIESITSSNSVVKMPVLRPLIAYDKIDIIKVSKDIDAYDTSILPYEDCCTVFLPKHPVIKPTLSRVLKEESSLNVEILIEDALNKTEKYEL